MIDYKALSNETLVATYVLALEKEDGLDVEQPSLAEAAGG